MVGEVAQAERESRSASLGQASQAGQGQVCRTLLKVQPVRIDTRNLSVPPSAVPLTLSMSPHLCLLVPPKPPTFLPHLTPPVTSPPLLHVNASLALGNPVLRDFNGPVLWSHNPSLRRRRGRSSSPQPPARSRSCPGPFAPPAHPFFFLLLPFSSSPTPLSALRAHGARALFACFR